MPTREQLKELLSQELEAYHAQTGTKVAMDDETPLFGNGSALDSIGLVMVITGFEARVNDTLDMDLVLASEKAMSMVRSPFRSVASLIEYTASLIPGAEA